MHITVTRCTSVNAKLRVINVSLHNAVVDSVPQDLEREKAFRCRLIPARRTNFATEARVFALWSERGGTSWVNTTIRPPSELPQGSPFARAMTACRYPLCCC